MEPANEHHVYFARVTHFPLSVMAFSMSMVCLTVRKQVWAPPSKSVSLLHLFE